MPRVLAWEELWDCPQRRPFWCSHPHCLWCNWDDEDCGSWTLAAFLGPTLPFERHYDPRYPDGHYIQERRYIAWLCEDCATDAALVWWFAELVARRYPAALIVRYPGAAVEAPFVTPPPEARGRIRTSSTAWQGVAIGESIRKPPPLIAAPLAEEDRPDFP